ncbi:MAG TPA: c-type cytochrome [Gammaproteobacteria bacterium]
MAARPKVISASALAMACSAAFAGDITTGDGAFTSAQAERGKQVYDEFCSSCHQVDFYETKLAAWQDASVGELFAALSATMPSANPGGLTSAKYLDVLAYIFSITGSPAGNDELSLRSMDAVRIVAPAVQPR